LNKQIIFTREELISRLLPLIYRKVGNAFNKEQLDNLITFYTYSESLDSFISSDNNAEVKIVTSDKATTFEMNKEYPITVGKEFESSINKIELAA